MGTAVITLYPIFNLISMLKPLAFIAFVLFAATCRAQAPANSTEVVDTVQMEFVRCPKIDTVLRCKRIVGFGLLKTGITPVTATNPAGVEVIDMQVYFDEQKKIIDRNKFDIFL